MLILRLMAASPILCFLGSIHAKQASEHPANTFMEPAGNVCGESGTEQSPTLTRKRYIHDASVCGIRPVPTTRVKISFLTSNPLGEKCTAPVRSPAPYSVLLISKLA